MLLSKIGVIDNVYYESVNKYKNNLGAAPISVFARFKDSLHRIVSIQEDAPVYHADHFLISDFNNRRYFKEAIDAKNCIPSLVPRIFLGSGDYVLNIFKAEDAIQNRRASVTLPVDNIILNHYSHLELWMKKASPTGQPLTVSIFFT